MKQALLIRLGWSVLVLLGVATITFLIVRLVPADPARVIAGAKADAETIAHIRTELRLDDPIWKQFGTYLGRVAKGDLGKSYMTNQPVVEAIVTRLPATLALCLAAVGLWMLLAIPIGVMTARHSGSALDRLVLVGCAAAISLPAFWLARMLQYELAYRAGLFPVAGLRSWRHLLLPALTLAILFAGYYARLVHSNMVEVLNSQYLRAAQAKGVSEGLLLFKHGLRNALIPVITILGMDVASLLGGVLFTENVFALPGIGTLALQAVFNLDVPMIMGTVLFSAALVVAANIAVDFLYHWIDPRVRGD
jgi:peptide/nickel transport system permease protein